MLAFTDHINGWVKGLSFSIEKRDKGYILFTITRNEKRNAINYEVMEGLSEVIKLSTEPGIKALVITGEGEKAFCSGGDLSVFHLLETQQDAYTMLSKMAEILYSLLTLPIPTVALMNGITVGGGCELAAACDFRLAKKGIKAGFVQGNQAITTGWGGGSILTEKLPHSVAMKILMEADLYPAEFLSSVGFFDMVYEDDHITECEKFLEKFLSKDVSVLQSYKKLWIQKWKASGLQKRIEEEVRNCSILWKSEAHLNYVKSFIHKKLAEKQ